ncbi:MarR family transcriptional regulator [Planotetraspora sp. A-T 1434]|uniref:MarR family winged helix-turn-helix transcriptional regulator n=1 Tax=Planotetraspora sp. A-T 1434 TaxID=2979219 RepID=UPI0021BEB181|nr:MarR family transcriptional regulator [Planotetraspora sp. A-T 1434]MCT9933326.1 MarR family transcriptional regulator [Planotetraspora sp. A-T 1434]
MTEDQRAADPVELMSLMRRLNVEVDRFSEQFAMDHGLHRTDLNALVVIMDASREGRPLSPGALGVALNLSAPATTALINRLEQAGHLERHRSATDRRKVELAMHQKAATLAARFFAPLGQEMTAALDEFTDEERRLISRFLARSIEATVTARELSARQDAHEGTQDATHKGGDGLE